MGATPRCLAVAPSWLHHRNLTGPTFLSMLHLQCCQRISMLDGLSRLRRGVLGLRTRMTCRSFMPNQPFSPSLHRPFTGGGYGQIEVARNCLLHFPPRTPGGHRIVANWPISNPDLRMILPPHLTLFPTPNASQPHSRKREQSLPCSSSSRRCVSFPTLRPHLLFPIVCRLRLARMRTRCLTKKSRASSPRSRASAGVAAPRHTFSPEPTRLPHSKGSPPEKETEEPLYVHLLFL